MANDFAELNVKTNRTQELKKKRATESGTWKEELNSLLLQRTATSSRASSGSNRQKNSKDGARLVVGI